jgi:hypothetical protein
MRLRVFQRERDVLWLVAFGLQQHLRLVGKKFEPLFGHAAIHDELHFVRAFGHACVNPLLGGDAEPHVRRQFSGDGSIRFDVHAPPVAPQRFNKIDRLALRQRLTARQHDHRTVVAEFAHLRDDVVDAREEF